MENYEKYLKNKGFSVNTISSYLFAITQLKAKLKDKLNDELLLSHKEWLASRYSAKTANIRITAINSYLDFIKYQGIRLKGIRIQQKPYLDNVISNQEYERLRDSLLSNEELFWYFIVKFLTCTGARVSELRMFTVESVKTGHLDIISKGQKLRRIYIPKALQNDALAWLISCKKQSGFVFVRNSNEPISARGISFGLKRYAKKYGINPDVVYPHSFRHLFAKNFIQKNPDIAFLADLMGHENIETTRIYLRRTAAEQRAIVDATIDW